MDVRKKLVEQIAKCEDEYPCRSKQDYREFKEYLADHLISNGVTVQEWIPVTEGLPPMRKEACMTDFGEYEYEISDPVFVLTKSNETTVCRVSFENGKHHWFDENCEEYDVTHWLSPPPLPGGKRA